MNYKLVCLFLVSFVFLGSATTFELAEGTDIKLEDKNSTIEIQEKLNTSGLEVYGTYFVLGERNISAYRDDGKNVNISLESYDSNISTNITFSTTPSSSQSYRFVLQGFSQPQDVYRIKSGDKEKFAESGDINISFELESGENKVIVQNYSREDEESSGSGDNGGSGESYPDTGGSEDQNATAKISLTTETKSLELGQNKTKAIDIGLRSNVSRNISGQLSLIGLSDLAELNREISFTEEFSSSVEVNSTEIKTGFYQGEIVFTNEETTERSEIDMKVVENSSESYSSLKVGKNTLNYTVNKSIDSSDENSPERFRIVIRNSTGDAVYTENVSYSQRMQDEIELDKIDSSRSYTLDTKPVDVSQNSSSEIRDQTGERRIEDLGSGKMVFVALVLLMLGVLMYVSLIYIRKDKINEKLSEEVESSLLGLKEEVEYREASEKSEAILENLRSGSSVPRSAPHKVREAKKALEDEDREKLNRKLDELEELIGSEG